MAFFPLLSIRCLYSGNWYKYSSLGQGVSMKPELKNRLHNHASGVIRCPEAQSLALDLRIQLHKRCHERSTYFSKSKKRKLENINATFKENTSNIQLFQSSQNLPSDISMQREDLFDGTENMVSVTNEMPMFSFNSVAVEPVNNENLRR